MEQLSYLDELKRNEQAEKARAAVVTDPREKKQSMIRARCWRIMIGNIEAQIRRTERAKSVNQRPEVRQKGNNAMKGMSREACLEFLRTQELREEVRADLAEDPRKKAEYRARAEKIRKRREFIAKATGGREINVALEC